jgi:DNA replicative helicase MCM subunit Mcm2 (Cdc46/Mcm family)
MENPQLIVKYLQKYHEEDICNVQSSNISEDDVKNYSILVDLKKIEQFNKILHDNIFQNPYKEMIEWTELFYKIQIETFKYRAAYLPNTTVNTEKYPVRFYNLQTFHPGPTFNSVTCGELIQFKGNFSVVLFLFFSKYIFLF